MHVRVVYERAWERVCMRVCACVSVCHTSFLRPDQGYSELSTRFTYCTNVVHRIPKLLFAKINKRYISYRTACSQTV